MSICIYHGGCNDGFGAAYSIWKKLGDSIEYYPGVYQSPPPDCTEKDVFIVDFSYKLEVMETIIQQANSVLVLDHHKTAKDDLIHLLNGGLINGEFSDTKSGAVLTWEWFHETSPPPLLNHIQDRDLWKFQLPDTKIISEALNSYPQSFDVWDELMFATDKLASEGRIINRYYRLKVDDAKKHAWRENIGGYDVPVVMGLPFMASDVAGELAINEPFAAVFWVGENHKTYSLRSRGDFDVSEIAKQFGGGGHKNAAGFKIELNK